MSRLTTPTSDVEVLRTESGGVSITVYDGPTSAAAYWTPAEAEILAAMLVVEAAGYAPCPVPKCGDTRCRRCFG